MKKFLLMLVCGFAVVCTACKDDGSDNPDFRLYRPEVTDITATEAAVSCRAGFDLESYVGVHAGFVCGPASEEIESYDEVLPAPAVNGRMLSGRLTGLTPATDYRVCGYIDLGAERVYSEGAEFRTAGSSLVGPVIEITGSGELSVPAGGGRFTIAYRLIEAVEGTLAAARSESAWVHSFDNATPDRIAFTVDANPGAARQAEIVVTCPDADPKRVRVLQAGTSGGGQTGKTKYSGWAELVPEDASNSDYHYAYHLCPDLKIGGYQARNYTVCFSAEHHCPVWVAAPRHACYEGSSGRSGYSKDPNIPSNIQYKNTDTGGGCNKGHMLGSKERTRSTAINKQVFYYSNIAPQYSSGFNTGGGGWNILEDWIDTQVCADTTYLVIGTYFEPYTDRYGNSASPKKISFGGRNDVSCPTMFYIAALRTKKGNSRKWVADCSADELKCAVFVRCHNNKLKGVEVSSKDMMSVADLERLTGFRFFTNVPNAPKETFNAREWGL